MTSEHVAREVEVEEGREAAQALWEAPQLVARAVDPCECCAITDRRGERLQPVLAQRELHEPLELRELLRDRSD